MAFNSMGSLFYLLCQWLLTVVVVPLCSFEAAGILTLSISLTNVFFTLATFGIRIFQVSDSQGKYGPGLYISTRVFTCLCSFALCAAFLLCNRQYTAEQVLCILFLHALPYWRGVGRRAGRRGAKGGTGLIMWDYRFYSAG